jgi:hypothetical protein
MAKHGPVWTVMRLLALAIVASAVVVPAWMLVGRAMARSAGHSVESRLDQFGDAAKARLAPHFAAAGLPLPPAELALLAFKDRAELELHARADGGDWRFVRRYPIRAASGVAGPKLREGDFQVPEGEYAVTFLNANSAYHVSLRLDYPSAFDRRMARHDGRTRLGGDIMIHGRAVSVGCLAMGDEAAEELFALAAWVGMRKLRVVIAPTDFRRGEGEAALPIDPPWVAELYAELKQRLGAFPTR